MADDPDVVVGLFAEIASEQQVIDLISAGTERLKRIQQAKRDLATLDPCAIREALMSRHAALGEGA